MLDLIKNLFESQRGEWNQTQQEALVDLLLLGMYTDNLISLAESDFIDSESLKLQWQSAISITGYLQRATPRVRDVKGDTHRRKELLQDIGNRLGDDVSKRRAIEELEALLLADGTVGVEENFIEEVKEILL